MRDRGAFVALRRVRRWKILISTLDKPFLHDYREPMLSSRALIDLCKIMDISRPKSIEVLVIPKNMEGIEGHFQCTFRNIHEALLPFRLLRNMPQGALRFRDAKKLEVNPQFIDTQVDPWSGIPVGPITTQLPNSVSLGELIHLAESKKPFEYATDMFAGLLRYAQVFERFEPFRLEMGKGQSYRLPRETVSSRYRYYFHDGFKNPFKYGREHPVERALWEAEAASDSEDLTAFKGFVPLSSPTSSPNTNGSCRYTRSLVSFWSQILYIVASSTKLLAKWSGSIQTWLLKLHSSWSSLQELLFATHLGTIRLRSKSSIDNSPDTIGITTEKVLSPIWPRLSIETTATTLDTFSELGSATWRINF